MRCQSTADGIVASHTLTRCVLCTEDPRLVGGATGLRRRNAQLVLYRSASQSRQGERFPVTTL